MPDREPPTPTYPPGPWVVVAALCDRAIVESNGLLSLIQILDRVVLTASASEVLDDPPVFGISSTVIIVLSGGPEFDGGLLALQVNSPSGRSRSGEIMPVPFPEGNHNARVTIDFQLSLKESGVYWIDVIFNERVLSRIPLQVVYQLEGETSPEPTIP